MVLIEIFENLVHENSVRHVEVCVEKLLKKFPGHPVHALTIFLLSQLILRAEESTKYYIFTTVFS